MFGQATQEGRTSGPRYSAIGLEYHITTGGFEGSTTTTGGCSTAIGHRRSDAYLRFAPVSSTWCACPTTTEGPRAEVG